MIIISVISYVFIYEFIKDVDIYNALEQMYI